MIPLLGQNLSSLGNDPFTWNRGCGNIKMPVPVGINEDRGVLSLSCWLHYQSQKANKSKCSPVQMQTSKTIEMILSN